MWLVAQYHPVTLFSFRSGTATSSGAKTLFLPTPFAVRTALLDAAIRSEGYGKAEEYFSLIKRLSIAISTPERVVVTNLFTKILKPTRKENAEKAMERTIAFREYAYLDGVVGIGLNMSEGQIPEKEITIFKNFLNQINYFGKRGCFFQLSREPEECQNLPEGYFPLDGLYITQSKVKGLVRGSYPMGIIQMMDDWGEGLNFNKVNIYTEEKIELGKDRVRKAIILPYRLVRSSKSFSYYEKI